ncbi:hypothetical protein BGZ58_004691 [Dissophora ornata]|nr:hypothetical protein BGZ58_004691 [Dissophora ornata]
MGYEYILIAAAILIPLGLFSVFKGDPATGTQLAEKKASLPGSFGDSTSTKSKKKKPKKKKGSSSTQATGASAEQEQESEESEVETKVVTQTAKKSNVTVASTKKGTGKKETAAPVATGNVSTTKSNTSVAPSPQTSSSSSNTNNSSNNSKNTAESKTVKPTSVENWKKQRQEQQKELLSKQQDQLQFASAAAKNTSSSSLDSSTHIASIPGPGAMGNSKKAKRGNAGSGLSHAEFPTLSRPQPTSAPAPKQPKPPKQKKEAVKKPEPEPEPELEPEPVQPSDEEEEEEEGSDEDHVASEDDDDKEEVEWTTVNSTQSRFGGIDFSKPMDPWVAQQQQQKLERIAAADPHGEQTEKFARVLSIKPAAKEERIREAIPDGFSTQKTRSGGSSGGSGQYQSAELTKKQRENIAKAAKKKEEKAAQDAIQEQRRLEHMRQVKSEKMKEFYRAQTRKQAPVESRWDAPKNTAPSSSGGMSKEASSNSQLIWD